MRQSLYQFLYHWLRKPASQVANRHGAAEYLRAGKISSGERITSLDGANSALKFH